MKKIVLGLLCIVLMSFQVIGAQGNPESVSPDSETQASRYASYAGTTSMSPSIVASTSWVGSIVRAAGASDVQVLAPIELRHPPEYDFSPQDIIEASTADLVFWAGYEGFIRNLVEAAEIPESRVFRVDTNNAPDKLAISVSQVAALLGTTASYERWKVELDKVTNHMLEQAQHKQTEKMTAAVQFHQQAFAKYLGYQVVAVFGPQEVSLGDVSAIESLNPDIIIDNWHSPQGQPFMHQDRIYVELINFPGPFETETLLDVLIRNATVLGLWGTTGDSGMEVVDTNT
jgi:zinc transport system substrate-binding protein/iron/zinc/copper transport system substrate-binding protein